MDKLIFNTSTIYGEKQFLKVSKYSGYGIGRIFSPLTVLNSSLLPDLPGLQLEYFVL